MLKILNALKHNFELVYLGDQVRGYWQQLLTGRMRMDEKITNEDRTVEVTSQHVIISRTPLTSSL